MMEKNKRGSRETRVRFSHEHLKLLMYVFDKGRRTLTVEEKNILGFFDFWVGDVRGKIVDAIERTRP